MEPEYHVKLNAKEGRRKCAWRYCSNRGKITYQPVYTILALSQPKAKIAFNFQGHGFIPALTFPDN